MFSKRSQQKEILDDLTLSDAELCRNLDEMELMNDYFGSKKSLIAALHTVFKKRDLYVNKDKIKIGDLGCGSGDLLRAMSSFAHLKKLEMELIGVDSNPFISQYAKEKSQNHPNITYITQNIFDQPFQHYQFDVTCMNSVCHHFDDETLVLLFQKLMKQTRIAIIVNDLQRHWLSYFFIKMLIKSVRFSRFFANDAPLSILRAFQKHELVALLQAAQIKSYQLNWVWPFRWQLIIWCKN